MTQSKQPLIHGIALKIETDALVHIASEFSRTSSLSATIISDFRSVSVSSKKKKKNCQNHSA